MALDFLIAGAAWAHGFRLDDLDTPPDPRPMPQTGGDKGEIARSSACQSFHIRGSLRAITVTSRQDGMPYNCERPRPPSGLPGRDAEVGALLAPGSIGLVLTIAEGQAYTLSQQVSPPGLASSAGRPP